MLFIIWFFSFRIIIIVLESILHMNLRNFKFELSHYKVWMVYSLQTAVLWSHDKSAHDKALEYFACVVECLQSIVSFSISLMWHHSPDENLGCRSSGTYCQVDEWKVIFSAYLLIHSIVGISLHLLWYTCLSMKLHSAMLSSRVSP